MEQVRYPYSIQMNQMVRVSMVLYRNFKLLVVAYYWSFGQNSEKVVYYWSLGARAVVTNPMYTQMYGTCVTPGTCVHRYLVRAGYPVQVRWVRYVPVADLEEDATPRAE